MRIIEEIRAAEVRVVRDEEQLGVMPVAQAQDLADNADLDLVEIAPAASPPVVKIIDYGKWKYAQSKKEREARKDLEGEETEHKSSRPEESMSRRANPMTSKDGTVKQGVFSNEHMDHGYGAACDVRRVVLYEGLKRDPRTGQSVATNDLQRQYMNPGQVLERTLTLEGHIELDKFSIEMMALEDVVILRDLCNSHLNQMVKKVSITT